MYLIKEPKIKSIKPLIFRFSYLFQFLHCNIAFYSLQNLPQQSVNAEAFAEAYPCFLVPASAKKMQRQLGILGILKNVPKRKNLFLFKKVNLVFHTIFKLDFIMQTIYCTYCLQMSVFSFHTFYCSLISVSKK